jgi:hypothetical protein
MIHGMIDTRYIADGVKNKFNIKKYLKVAQIFNNMSVGKLENRLLAAISGVLLVKH